MPCARHVPAVDSDDRLRAAAGEVRAEMAEMPSPADVVKRVEALVR